ASSPAEEFVRGRFNEILGSPEAGPVEGMKRIIFCSGKVYYDLLKYRSDRKIDDAAIIRIEQLYPLAEKKLREILKPFSKNAKLIWCQEEPENMGAGTFIEPRWRTLFCPEIADAGGCPPVFRPERAGGGAAPRSDPRGGRAPPP